MNDTENAMAMILPGLRRDYKEMIRGAQEKESSYGQHADLRKTEDLLKCCFINLDKPSGPTSHQAADYVKRILKAKKAGHSGTLDPKVTGVLPIGIGRAAKLSQLLLPAGKEYVGIMHLHDDVTDEALDNVVKEFTGVIEQLPPIKSAVRRQLRKRSVYYFNIIEISKRDVLFRTGVEAGTYIRKLCHDIGERLGCGAHMGDLRRTKAGPFSEDNSVILHDIRDAYQIFMDDNNDKPLRRFILPPEAAIPHIPKVYVSDEAVWSICHGSPLYLPGVMMIDSDVKFQKTVAMMTMKKELIGFGMARMNAEDAMKKNKGIVCMTDSVIMDAEHYPKPA